jgi:hypothetical protein
MIAQKLQFNNYYVSMRNRKRFKNGIGIEYESVNMSSFNT